MKALVLALLSLALGLGSWWLTRRHALALVSSDYRAWIDCLDRTLSRAGPPGARFHSVLQQGSPDALKELRARHVDWELSASLDGRLDRYDAIVLARRLAPPGSYEGREAAGDRARLPEGDVTRAVLAARPAYELRVCAHGAYWAAVASRRFRPEMIEVR